MLSGYEPLQILTKLVLLAYKWPGPLSFLEEPVALFTKISNLNFDTPIGSNWASL
jgi:hypothetical protein